MPIGRTDPLKIEAKRITELLPSHVEVRVEELPNTTWSVRIMLQVGKQYDDELCQSMDHAIIALYLQAMKRMAEIWYDERNK